jgi:hypothetical protein
MGVASPQGRGLSLSLRSGYFRCGWGLHCGRGLDTGVGPESQIEELILPL